MESFCSLSWSSFSFLRLSGSVVTHDLQPVGSGSGLLFAPFHKVWKVRTKKKLSESFVVSINILPSVGDR